MFIRCVIMIYLLCWWFSYNIHLLPLTCKRRLDSNPIFLSYLWGKPAFGYVLADVLPLQPWSKCNVIFISIQSLWLRQDLRGSRSVLISRNTHMNFPPWYGCRFCRSKMERELWTGYQFSVFGDFAFCTINKLSYELINMFNFKHVWKWKYPQQKKKIENVI